MSTALFKAKESQLPTLIAEARGFVGRKAARPCLSGGEALLTARHRSVDWAALLVVRQALKLPMAW